MCIGFNHQCQFCMHAAILYTGSSIEECHGSEGKLIQAFREGCPSVFSDVKCALRQQEEIQQWLIRNNNFKVLITGKMGTGKTTLVKGLNDPSFFVAEEDHLEPHTVKVTPYQHEHDRVDFTFFDTPGLKDDVNGSNDYSYLKEMVEKNEQPDLIIFAVKMDDAEFRQEDIGAIKNITDAFGWKVWKNAMFVLTFANKVSKPGHALNSRENRVYYDNLKNEFSIHVTKLLRKLNVQEDVASNIPVIPVGLVSQPLIESEGERDSWVEKFWRKLFKVLKASRQEPPSNNEDDSKKEDEPQSSQEDGCNCDCSKDTESSSWWCFWPLC